MKGIDDLLAREGAKRKKQRRLGRADLCCPICGETHPAAFEHDHVAGQKHHDQTWPLCKNSSRHSDGLAAGRAAAIK